MIMRFRVVAALAFAVAAIASPAFGQAAYPERPITLLLPYAAGGGTDAIARVFAEKLAQKLGGSIVVENRPGAGGNLATDAASNAKPDGYTLLIGNQGPMVVNIHMFKNMRTDPEKTLEPIVLIADAGLVVVVNPKKYPFKTLKDLVDEMKKQPGALTYGSASNASASHLATLMLAHVTGIKARHVPYRGAAPAIARPDRRPRRFHDHDDAVRARPDRRRHPDRAGHHQREARGRPAEPADRRRGRRAGLCRVRLVRPAWRRRASPPRSGRNSKRRRPMFCRAGSVAKLNEDGATPSGLKSDAFRAFMAKERATWAEVIKAANLSLN